MKGVHKVIVATGALGARVDIQRIILVVHLGEPTHRLGLKLFCKESWNIQEDDFTCPDL